MLDLVTWTHHKEQSPAAVITLAGLLTTRDGDDMAKVIKRARPGEVKLCEVEGCEKRHHSLGYCPNHWARFWKYERPICAGNQVWVILMSEPLKNFKSIVRNNP